MRNYEILAFILQIDKYNMNKFKPTYLYIKQHNETGLKYFGKTVRNPTKYKGSGLHWTAHLKTHGNNVTTVWYMLFEDKNELFEYATKFSIDNDIVESAEWANLKPENGVDGFTIGHTYGTIRKGRKFGPQTEEHRKKNSLAQIGNTHATGLKGYKQTAEHIENRIAPLRGKQLGPQSQELIAKRFKKKICPHCGISCTPTNYARWHNDNCKVKI